MRDFVPISEPAANSLDVSQAMIEMLGAVGKAVPNDVSCLVFFAGDSAQVTYAYGLSAEVTAALQGRPVSIATTPIFLHALVDKAPYLVMDTATNPDWMPYSDTGWIRSSLGVPLERHGKVIGMLTADSASRHHFQPTDLVKLDAFARVASLLLDHADYAVALAAEVARRTQELQAANNQAESIFNHSVDAIALIGDDLQIIKNNARFGQLFLGEVVDCQGRSLLAFLHPTEWTPLQARVKSIGLQESEQDLEIYAYRQDGSVFDVALRISSIPGRGLVCTLRDITEHKAYIRQLRFVAGLQENVTEAVISTDLDFRIQSWNKAAAVIYGWSAAEAIGQTTMDLLKTRYPEETNRDLAARTLLMQGHWEGEVVQQHKDGAQRYIWASVTLLRDDQQRPYAAIAISRDISEYKAAAAVLAEREHFITQIAEVAPATIYLFDIVAQRNIYSNRSIGTLLGYSPEEIKAIGNELITDLLHPEDRPAFVEHTAQLLAMQEDHMCVFAYRMRHKDGTWRWLESRDKVFQRNAAGEVTQLIGIATDITEGKQAVEALRAHHDFLQQEVVKLEGILPICSHCKKIRNESNDWEQMEVYITRHSEAAFSHSICPDCMQIHYGDVLKRRQQKANDQE